MSDPFLIEGPACVNVSGGRWKVTACLACTERRIGRAAA